jgi:hypothetical protein
MAAACELPLSSGRLCGVVARGRCDVCERAFCSSHRSMPVPTLFSAVHLTTYVDVCMACVHVTQQEELARQAAKRATFEEEVRRDAQSLTQAEATFWQVLHALCVAGYPGIKRRYRRTRSSGYLLSTKRKRVDAGIGWHVGQLEFKWIPSYGDFNVGERVVSRPAMVVSPNWSVVHAEPDDMDRDQRDETIIRSSSQVWTVVSRLQSYLLRR